MSPLKRKLTFLIVTAAVAACAAGAYAATQTSSTSPRKAFFNDVAHRLHVTPAQLKKAMAGAFADRLSALVASGRLTKAQASAIEQRMKSSGRFAGPGPFGIAGFGPGFGRGFAPGMRRGLGRGMRPGFGPGSFAYPPNVKPGAKLPPNGKLPPGAKPGAVLPPGVTAPAPRAGAMPLPLFGGPAFGFLLPGGMKATVSYLKIRPAELLAELRAGKSLAEIAKVRGKSVSGLESAIESPFKTRLSRQVAAKHLTKAQASKLMSAIDARVAGGMNLKVQRLPARFRARVLPGLRRFGPVPHGAAKKHLGALFPG
ncbi:MAG TPA: hypothetical protein VG321_01465 [Solirubrobacteraceae bacterium]|nr:hypothetical protein [Solirubrobacteraceae bacterium]